LQIINIGYVPYSFDLKHPADRRRLGSWAAAKEIELNLKTPLESDVLVLSNGANFGHWIKRSKQPVVLDLVDAYLGEKPSFAKDFLRNIVRSIRGTSDLHWITYSRHLKNACESADLVVVASEEQKELVYPFNKNVVVIQDDHFELDNEYKLRSDTETSSVEKSDKPHLFWEGYGYTLKHFQVISSELDRFLSESGWGMYLITVGTFPKWGGYLGKVSTQKEIRKYFPKSWKSIQVIPWTLSNLVTFATKSQLGVIPISAQDNFAVLKSENKLLSMWHLKLPVLFSDIPSYLRVAKTSDNLMGVVKQGEWHDKLLLLAADEELRERFRIQGEKYVASNHSHSGLVEKWDDAMQSLVNP